MPMHKNPALGVMKKYNFGRPFLCYHYYILGLTDQCMGVEKTISKEIRQFYTFYPKITSPLGGWS